MHKYLDLAVPRTRRKGLCISILAVCFRYVRVANRYLLRSLCRFEGTSENWPRQAVGSLTHLTSSSLSCRICEAWWPVFHYNSAVWDSGESGATEHKRFVSNIILASLA